MKKRDAKAKSSGANLKVVGPSLSGRAKNGDKNGGGGDSVDFESVRELARIAAEFDLAEIEVDRAGHMRVRRGGGPSGEAAPVASPGPRSIALAAPAPVEPPAEAGTFVSSPFVGTFYRAPSPEAPAFVEVGQAVRKGQVVCIVEAMKLMNEIEAEADGRVEEILVQNGEHVEYGQHLVRLSK
jgi:acetyl-CoA carboxylase biotin carboxyl carrier protein